MSVDVAASGQFGVCCDAEPTGVASGETPFEKWFNGTYLTEIRDQMKRGEAPKVCSRCKQEENFGRPSPRHDAIQNFREDFYAKEESYYARPRLMHLNYRFGNKCNLSCIMCHETSSTAVGAEKEKLGEGRRIDIHNPIELSQTNLKSMKSLYLGGGEPALSKECLTLLDRLLKVGNDTVDIWLNSNGSLPKAPLFEKLKSFKSVYVAFSIDGTKDTYELLRHPMKWDKLQRNLEEFFTRFPNFGFGVIFTLQAPNVANVPEFLEWFESKKGPGRFQKLQINDLVHPEWLNPRLAGQESIATAIGQLEKRIAACGSLTTPEAQEFLRQLNLAAPRPGDEDLIKIQRNHIERRKALRNSIALGELADELGATAHLASDPDAPTMALHDVFDQR